MILPRRYGCTGLFILLFVGLPLGVAATPDANTAPVRPDLSTLTPDQAVAAMAEYRKAEKEWELVEAPLQEAAFKAALAEQKALIRKRELAEQAGEKPEPFGQKGIIEAGPDYDWARAAHSQGLDEAARNQLKRDGLIVAGPSFPQSFSLYGDDKGVVPFITSDSLLNGFHVLLEASLKRFELRRAGKLRVALESLWLGIEPRLVESKVPRPMMAPYVRHIAMVIGPSLRLLGSTVSLGDASVEAEVDATVALINAAEATALPGWLGPVEPSLLGIDFRRCRPLGFYTDTPTLQAYYRAVRWLQLVPLRASRDHEAGAGALMTEAMKYGRGGLPDFVKQGEEIWGEENEYSLTDWSVDGNPFSKEIAREGNATTALSHVKEWIVRASQLRRSRVNDRLRDPGEAGANQDAVLTLAPTILPDTEFLERLRSSRTSEQTWPQGLEVAAWLGSEFALNELRRSGGDKLVEAITVKNELGGNRWGNDVPGWYYDTLAALFAPPDVAAPQFMSSEAWQRKSVQTALAGWAQLRHAWELQTKLIFSAASFVERPAGFVEPNALFFQRLGQLERRVVAVFQAAGVFGEDKADEIEFLRGLLQMAHRYGLGKIAFKWDEYVDSEDSDRVYDLVWIAHQIDIGIDSDQGLRTENPAPVAYWRRVLAAVETRIERLERGERVPVLDALTYRHDPDTRLFERWQDLQELTSRLEAMVQKQLREAVWNEEEARLFTNYREHLGGIMGYMGAAAMGPKDDAPRWTAVFHDPAIDRNLAVAIGRPRALYVLYPWKGNPILCRGAVMTYYEYPSEKRLTDGEWKALLDSPAAPKQPVWVQPILAAPATK